MKPWHLTARPKLTHWDRLRLIFGVPLYVRFSTPDGECHAGGCGISVSVQREWPKDSDILGGWPPLPYPLPPPPAAPTPPQARDTGYRNSAVERREDPQ